MSGLPEHLRRPPRGMRDWLPPQLYALIEMEERLSKVAESFGYRRVETPVVEHFEVLAKKAGQEVVNEIYYFKDKAGRDVGLRFDMTVPVARVISYNLDLPRPVRWYYFTKVFRYDEPQHGRYREFHQFGIELVGSASPRADAEVIQVFIEALEAAGARDYVVKINDRRAVDKLLESLGVLQHRDVIYRALDKKYKLPREQVVDIMTNGGVPIDKAERIYDASEEMTLEEAVDAVLRLDAGLGSFYQKLVGYLATAVPVDRLRFDMSIVRGLDYYTGVVFEAYVGKYRLAVGGGGRYDDLLELYSGVKMPALGFAIGVERLMEAVGLERVEKPLDYYIYIFDDGAYPHAVALAKKLRAAGHSVAIELGEKNLKDAFEYILKVGTKYLIIMGRRELERGVVKIRDLQRREEFEKPLAEF
ncbi:histidine--tRNA ligase [Pyrobaculum neutrophilum]|uniref:Histidine--tRNA ligase n=1 Tax=Pyrobaculum neutrophilum (strain DSM 2338 / JCM 9278 / NBRC 100436 / V24Sta) TaxID=444157 RepID=SYH_PYRNV|nr:histidine--tRNA ligase [Pyrobaculum neutrophilum]B1YCS2.1 RecName: Full=Histidine--tRNA ligase; AltName: Full=Histidyl-tRNA synthetase; Short=HisRS [Pyrobaculum neutrophilum V24Sta]ACB39585.1 histidyl-tRNA synthetase [Pyrobaculum neutrophilum V24Sta]